MGTYHSFYLKDDRLIATFCGKIWCCIGIKTIIFYNTNNS